MKVGCRSQGVATCLLFLLWHPYKQLAWMEQHELSVTHNELRCQRFQTPAQAASA